MLKFTAGTNIFATAHKVGMLIDIAGHWKEAKWALFLGRRLEQIVVIVRVIQDSRDLALVIFTRLFSLQQLLLDSFTFLLVGLAMIPLTLYTAVLDRFAGRTSFEIPDAFSIFGLAARGAARQIYCRTQTFTFARHVH